MKKTLAEARAHFGFADEVSDDVVRQAAKGAGIEITDEPNPLAELRKVAEELAKAATAANEGQKQEQEAETARTLKEAQAILAGFRGGSLSTPSKTESEPVTRGFNHIERGWMDVDPNIRRMSKEDRDDWFRANYELAMMIVGGTRQIPTVPTVQASQELQRAWQHHVFERNPDGAPRVRIPTSSDDEPERTRAMDTQETGYGLELVGAEYVGQLWAAARNNDTLVGDIRTIPMNAPTVYVPIDGDLPEMLFVGESTSASASAYTTSKTASSRVSMTAKKFTIQQVWSGELDEDSIIAFTPFLREKLSMSTAQYLGSAYLNGDTTDAGTGNINLDDANPGNEKHYLAWDGIRHRWLVDATSRGLNQAAALDVQNINVIRGRLNGGDDDVDNAVRNINWGKNPRELRLISDWDTYMAMLDTDKVVTVDKYGPAATILNGELGSIYGIPIISPSYASKTEADGKASDTEASNTKGQISLFNPAGFLGGSRREVQLFFDRIQRTDQFLFELYTRRAFTTFSTTAPAAAGIYNISL